MVTSSGLTSTPTTLVLLALLPTLSTLTSVLSLQHLLPLHPTPHLWPYLQLWRPLTFQLAYPSSVSLLLASALIYHLRVLERIWGARKFASFVVASYFLCAAGTTGLAIVLDILTLGWCGHVPAGMTGVVVAIVAAWRRETPRLGGLAIVLDERGGRVVYLSSRWTVYVLVALLGAGGFPFGLVAVLVGWVVGNAWVEEVVPRGLTVWRVPGWMVGEGQRVKQGRLESLRRRLEVEGGITDGMRGEMR